MNKKKILFGVSSIILIFIFINGIRSVEEFTDKIPLKTCLDYAYKLEFEESELPVTVTYYTIETGEEIFFKTEIIETTKFTTDLHCGHEYKAVYQLSSGEFTDYFTIPKTNPLIFKTTKISMTNG